MRDEGKLEKRENAAAPRVSAPAGEEIIYIPDVDIGENGESVKVVANMPGVDEKSVDVTVENNVLRIEGRAQVEKPAGYELVGREYAATRFRRDFSLSDSVDTTRIQARMKNGVLLVTLPKREEVKTRKIEISAD
jgi:HSP20 family protein